MINNKFCNSVNSGEGLNHYFAFDLTGRARTEHGLMFKIPEVGKADDH